MNYLRKKKLNYLIYIKSSFVQEGKSPISLLAQNCRRQAQIWNKNKKEKRNKIDYTKRRNSEVSTVDDVRVLCSAPLPSYPPPNPVGIRQSSCVVETPVRQIANA